MRGAGLCLGRSTEAIRSKLYTLKLALSRGDIVAPTTEPPSKAEWEELEEGKRAEREEAARVKKEEAARRKRERKRAARAAKKRAKEQEEALRVKRLLARTTRLRRGAEPSYEVKRERDAGALQGLERVFQLRAAAARAAHDEIMDCEYERHGCHAHVDEAFDFDAAVAADMMREADEMGLMEWVVVDEQAFDEHCERMEHSLAACMP